ncbi:MAG: FHA domain-containing protein [Labilithrix sp.]|nr:FHA domain-containing protein [Labilithrix sp.]
MHLQVVVQSDAGAQRTELYPASGPLTIGRHPQCSLRLDSDLVSRQHAVVSAGHGALRVEDVSTNGTIAGDLLLRRDSVEVPYGTPIVVGDFTVFVYALDQQGNPIGPTAAQIQQNDTRQRLQSGSNPGMNGPGMNGPGMNGPGMNGRVPVPTVPPRGMAPTSAVPIPNVSGMNPVIAHVGSQPGPKGVHLPARGEDDKLKAEVALRREIHKLLLEHLDLATIDAKKLDDPSMRPKVLNALRRIIAQIDSRIPPEMDRDGLIGELADEALGLGPLERFLSDGTITEIMVVDRAIYIEQGGKILLSQARYTRRRAGPAPSSTHHPARPAHRRVVAARRRAALKDGSRVNAVYPPVALRGSCITIESSRRSRSR